MSPLGWFMAFFPAGWMLGAGALFLGLFHHPGWLLPLLMWVYLLPLLLFRIHQRLHPFREGVSRLRGAEYHPWWGAHQLQSVYIAFSVLEVPLRLLPGCYSLWLRGWGSRIGRGVYWTPLVEITDRSLLEVGDGVIFGHRCGLYGHIIKPKGDNLMLYTARVRVGEGAFIGAGVALAPGVRVGPRVMVPAGTHLYPRQKMNETPGPPSSVPGASGEAFLPPDEGAEASR